MKTTQVRLKRENSVTFFPPFFAHRLLSGDEDEEGFDGDQLEGATNGKAATSFSDSDDGNMSVEGLEAVESLQDKDKELSQHNSQRAKILKITFEKYSQKVLNKCFKQFTEKLEKMKK